jgi:class 3 adenylate cyclase
MKSPEPPALASARSFEGQNGNSVISPVPASGLTPAVKSVQVRDPSSHPQGEDIDDLEDNRSGSVSGWFLSDVTPALGSASSMFISVGLGIKQREIVASFVPDLLFRNVTYDSVTGQHRYLPWSGRMTVLLVDVCDYSRVAEHLSETGAHLLSDVINGYFAVVVEVVRKFGGDILKFAGDAILIGWVTESPTDGCRAAVLCAQALHRRAAAYNVPILACSRKATSMISGYSDSVIVTQPNSEDSGASPSGAAGDSGLNFPPLTTEESKALGNIGDPSEGRGCAEIAACKTGMPAGQLRGLKLPDTITDHLPRAGFTMNGVDPRGQDSTFAPTARAHSPQQNATGEARPTGPTPHVGPTGIPARGQDAARFAILEATCAMAAHKKAQKTQPPNNVAGATAGRNGSSGDAPQDATGPTLCSIGGSSGPEERRFEVHIGIVHDVVTSEVFKTPDGGTEMPAAFHFVGGPAVHRVGVLVNWAPRGKTCVGDEVALACGGGASADDPYDERWWTRFARTDLDPSQAGTDVGTTSVFLTVDPEFEAAPMSAKAAGLVPCFCLQMGTDVATVAACSQASADIRSEVAPRQRTQIEALFVPPLILSTLRSGLPASHISSIRLLFPMFIKKRGRVPVAEWFGDVCAVLHRHQCPATQIIDDDKGVHVVAALNLVVADPAAGDAAVQVCRALLEAGVECIVGVAAGSVLCGVMGDERKACRWDMTGTTCVRACRVMQYAEAFALEHPEPERLPRVVAAVDESVVNELHDMGSVGLWRRGVSLKGSSTPCDLYTVMRQDTPILRSMCGENAFADVLHQRERDLLRHRLRLTPQAAHLATQKWGRTLQEMASPLETSAQGRTDVPVPTAAADVVPGRSGSRTTLSRQQTMSAVFSDGQVSEHQSQNPRHHHAEAAAATERFLPVARAAIVSGPPLSGKESLLLSALSGTAFIPIHHRVHRNATVVDLCHTLAAWFTHDAFRTASFYPAAQRCVEEVQRRKVSSTVEAAIEMLSAIEDCGMMLAVVLSHCEYIDDPTLRLVQVVLFRDELKRGSSSDPHYNHGSHALHSPVGPQQGPNGAAAPFNVIPPPGRILWLFSITPTYGWCSAEYLTAVISRLGRAAGRAKLRGAVNVGLSGGGVNSSASATDLVVRISLGAVPYRALKPIWDRWNGGFLGAEDRTLRFFCHDAGNTPGGILASFRRILPRFLRAQMAVIRGDSTPALLPAVVTEKVQLRVLDSTICRFRTLPWTVTTDVASVVPGLDCLPVVLQLTLRLVASLNHNDVTIPEAVVESIATGMFRITRERFKEHIETLQQLGILRDSHTADLLSEADEFLGSGYNLGTETIDFALPALKGIVFGMVPPRKMQSSCRRGAREMRRWAKENRSRILGITAAMATSFSPEQKPEHRGGAADGEAAIDAAHPASTPIPQIPRAQEGPSQFDPSDHDQPPQPSQPRDSGATTDDRRPADMARASPLASPAEPKPVATPVVDLSSAGGVIYGRTFVPSDPENVPADVEWDVRVALAVSTLHARGHEFDRAADILFPAWMKLKPCSDAARRSPVAYTSKFDAPLALSLECFLARVMSSLPETVVQARERAFVESCVTGVPITYDDDAALALDGDEIPHPQVDTPCRALAEQRQKDQNSGAAADVRQDSLTGSKAVENFGAANTVATSSPLPGSRTGAPEGGEGTTPREQLVLPAPPPRPQWLVSGNYDRNDEFEFPPAVFDAVHFPPRLCLGPIGARLRSIQSFGIVGLNLPMEFSEAHALQEVFVYWHCVAAMERVVPRTYVDVDPGTEMDAELVAQELPLLRRMCQQVRRPVEATLAESFCRYATGVVMPRARRVVRWAAEMRQLPENARWAAVDGYGLEQPLIPYRCPQHMGMTPAQRREQRRVLRAAYQELVDVCLVEAELRRPEISIEVRPSHHADPHASFDRQRYLHAGSERAARVSRSGSAGGCSSCGRTEGTSASAHRQQQHRHQQQQRRGMVSAVPSLPVEFSGDGGFEERMTSGRRPPYPGHPGSSGGDDRGDGRRSAIPAGGADSNKGAVWNSLHLAPGGFRPCDDERQRWGRATATTTAPYNSALEHQRRSEAVACRRALQVLAVGHWVTPMERMSAFGVRDAWLRGSLAPVEVKAIILMFLLADVNA